MATIVSAQAGNWSATTTWVGGVVPASVDDVRMDHAIQADIDISIANFLIPATSAGRLIVSTSRTITCSGNIPYNQEIFQNNVGLITITSLPGSTVTINASTITAPQGVNSGNPCGFCILANGGGTVNINATTILGGRGGDIGTFFGGYSIGVRGSGTIININGNLVTSSVAAAAYTAVVLSYNVGKTINITGTVTSGATSVVNSSVADTITINGVTQSVGSNAVTSTSATSAVRVGGVITNFGNRIGIFSPNVQILNTVPTNWTFQTENALVNKTLYDTTSLPSLPAITDVRNAVSYANGTLTGTLVVPPASAVTAGVTYDNGTVGTAQNTAASFLAALSASSDPLAERLRNVSTVQTTGDQIAAAL